MLLIKNLSKSFQDQVILNDINWHILPGHIYGLIGKNGAGKSTLLRCISGVYEIDHGQMFLEGVNINDNPNVKRDVVLLSDFPFELKQSSLAQLSEFYQIFYPQFDKSIYRYLVELFSFNENKPLNKLSKGLKRQASLIVVLSLKPKLLLLDEAYDGLDPTIRTDLTRFLQQQFLNENRSIIISSHNVHELEHLCDEMVILENNEIQLQESKDQTTHSLIKVQIGFNYDLDIKSLKALKPIDLEQEGRVYKIIIDSTFEDFKEKVKDLHPALIYQLELPIQELFLKKIEVKNHERTV